MNQSVFKAVLATVLLGVLSGCASVKPVAGDGEPTVAVVSAEAAAAEAQRQSQLRAQSQWAFQGRAAISKGHDGGNGRLDWRQDGPQYRVELSAPVTRQSWVLTGDAGQARLDGLAGGARSGTDAAQLLREATGWEIPVGLLVEWVRGLPPAGVRYSQDVRGRPRAFEQSGWSIQYLEWHDAAPDTPALPRHIDAVRGDAKVRLIIDQWEGAQS